MTWEELKEEAKKMGYTEFETSYYDDDGYEVDGDALSNGELTLYEDGRVVGGKFKPDQILAIMKALQ